MAFGWDEEIAKRSTLRLVYIPVYIIRLARKKNRRFGVQIMSRIDNRP